MIQINLLPEELRQIKAETKKSKPRDIVYTFYVLFIFLIFFHFLFLIIGISRTVKFTLLNKRWNSLLDKRKVLEDFKKEYLQESESTNQANQILKNRISFTKVLNCLILNLPRGIWFNNLNFDKNVLSISASVVSLEKEEMVLVNKFIDNLKNDKYFSNNFKKIQLGSIQKRNIAGYEVFDFSLKAER